MMARYQMPVAGGAAQDAATGLALGDRDQQKRQLHVTRPREVTTLALGAIGVGAGALGLRYVVEVRPRRRAAACVLLVGGRWAVARKEVFCGVDEKWVFLMTARSRAYATWVLGEARGKRARAGGGGEGVGGARVAGGERRVQSLVALG